MNTSASLLFFCLPLIVILLASWGVGSLMKTIGGPVGWNPNRTFWTASILCALSMIILTAFSMFALPSSLNVDSVLFFIFLGVGVLSPVINLVIKWAYPDKFNKSTPSQMDGNPKNQVVFERKTSPRKHLSSNSGNAQQNKPEFVKPPVDSKSPKPQNETAASRIFISYRRSDSADIAGRIYDRLIGRFGRGPIFKDVDSIPLGLDFKEYLDRKVGECNVLLAIIGDRWLDASDETGEKRLDDPTDFVRIEIESALERGIPVIPLLVRHAQMPPEQNLPSTLRKLVYRNGIQIRSDPDFHHDMDRLISALEKYIQ